MRSAAYDARSVLLARIIFAPPSSRPDNRGSESRSGSTQALSSPVPPTDSAPNQRRVSLPFCGVVLAGN